MTDLFGPAFYTGTQGGTLNAAAEGATSLAGANPIYDGTGYARGGTRAKFVGNGTTGSQLIRDGTFASVIYISEILQNNGAPGVGNNFDYGVLRNQAGSQNIATLGVGAQGGLYLTNGATGTNVASSGAQHDYTTQLFRYEWKVDTVLGIQTLITFDAKGVYMETLTGACLAGTAVTRFRTGINSNGSAATVWCDDTHITDAALVTQPLILPAVHLTYDLWASTTTFDVNVLSVGLDQVRLHLPTQGIYSTAIVPTFLSLYESQLSTHRVTGLTHNTEYAFNVEGYYSGAWHVIDSGFHKTEMDYASAPGNVYTRIQAVLACSSNYKSTIGPVNDAWTHAQSTVKPDDWWAAGDVHYKNLQSDDRRDYYREHVLQINAITAFTTMAKYRGFYYNFSDHEIGNNFENGHSTHTLALAGWWHDIYPNYTSPLATETAAVQSRIIGNDICEIYLDFRNYERGDSSVYAYDYSGTDTYGDSYGAFGPEQFAWLENLFGERHRFYLLHLEAAWAPLIDGAGNPKPLTNKNDSMPSYMVMQMAIGVMMQSAKGIIIGSDLHALGIQLGANNLFGGWPVFTSAATDGTMTYRGGNYDQYFPSTGGDGTTPTKQYGVMTLQDDFNSGVLSITCDGWDFMTGSAVKQVSQVFSWDLSTRVMFGGSGADIQTVVNQLSVLAPASASVFDTYTEVTGGTLITDLLDESGAPTTVVKPDNTGRIIFYGPPNYNFALWLQDKGNPGGTRWRVDPSNLASQLLGGLQGPAGPQGIQGPTGGQGPAGGAGIQGPVGPAGANATWPGLAVARWYSIDRGVAATALALTNNTMYLMPFVAPAILGRNPNLAGVGCNITIGGTSGTLFRYGLYYADATNCLPGLLAADYGTVAADTAGYKKILPGSVTTLQPGAVYFLAMVPQGGAPTVSTRNDMNPMVSADATAGDPTVVADIYTSFKVTGVTGALANSPVIASLGQGPNAWVKFS